MTPLLISLKPRFSTAIFDGTKTIEIRRRFPEFSGQSARMLIYTTAPEKCLNGEVVVTDAIRFGQAEIETTYLDRTGVSPEELDGYISDIGSGVLVFVSTPVLYGDRRIPLADLRTRFGFTPPQSYAYARDEILRTIDNSRERSDA